MKDNLKKYVDENRRQFECYETDLDALWKDVSDNLDREQQGAKTFKLSFRMFARVAAVVVLAVGVGFMVQKMTVNPAIAEQERLGKLYPELAEAEQHYAPIISDRMKVIQANRASVGEQVFSDLEALDKAYKELKEDLKDNAANAEVIDAMIQNYRIKLQILEDISKQIKQDNEKPQHEASAI